MVYLLQWTPYVEKLVEMWIKQLIFSHFLRICVIFVKFEKSIENKIYYIYNNLCKILNFYYLKEGKGKNKNVKKQKCNFIVSNCNC